MARRGKRPSFAAFAAAMLLLAQATGCGSCVKDDPQPTSTSPENVNAKHRKPLTLKAVEKQFTEFEFSEGGARGAADASAAP
jgi:hypothetical protein